jgi:thiol-disulfide isomerase/thioredoxin
MLELMKAARTHASRVVVLILCVVFSPQVAESAPNQVLDLNEYRGKVIYLDFWASWCAPCLESFPWMNEIQRAYGRAGLVVVAVNVDRDGALAQRFLTKQIPDFKIIYDPDGRIAKQYDLKDMPTSILIGHNGKIRYVHSGFYTDRKPLYLSHIRELLNDKTN